MKELFRRKLAKNFIVLLALLVVALTVSGCQVLDSDSSRIAQGVTIGGLDVGGMTRDEARDALQAAAAETVLTRDLIVSLPEQDLSLSPSQLGLELDVNKAVDTAVRAGKDEHFPVYDIGLLPYLTLNRDALRDQLQTYADTYDTELTQPSYSITGTLPELSTELDITTIPCQTLQITMGLPTALLDVEDAIFLVLEEYDNAIADCRSGTYGITVEVPRTELPQQPDLDAIYAEFSIPAVNDSLDMQTYGFVHGSYGYHFNSESALLTVGQAGYGETVTVSMECVEPEILGEGVYFRDVLGACDTKHTTNENRNTNLRLLCEALNGLIIEPGEDFSYNESVGERTSERGYMPAPAYSGDKLVDAVGGGVCQGSSTLYNCVLLADLEVTNRLCHGGTVSYLPLGLDATVNWGTTDFCFRNNANFPIKLWAEVSDGYLRMKILGTDEKDYYVKMEARSYEDGDAIFATSYKCKYDKETNELISREKEAHSTYYKNVG